jgi:hypothetical protein
MNRIDTNELTWAQQVMVFRAVCENYDPFACSNCPNCANFEMTDPE